MQAQNPSNSDARMTRGLSLFENKGRDIKELEDGSFFVPSQTSGTLSYEVRLLEDRYVCTCPDFEQREIEFCKHIHAVKFWIASNTYLKEQAKPKVFSEDCVQCPKCGSIRIVKFGHADNKQVFKCKDCAKKFREISLLKKAHYSPELVTLTLDLYFSGMSLRKISRTVSAQFHVDIHHTSIFIWLQKYVPQISEYVNSLSPQLSDTWHADEVYVKMKDGIKFKVGKREYDKTAFLWNVMDRKTRFLLASKLSRFRDEAGAGQAFDEAIKNAHGSTPDQVFTDSLRSYNTPIFDKLPQAYHVARAGVKKPHANNNRIERLNGTVRERTKVTRGWKSMESQLAEGQRIHYNFVKPHQALEGMTPAQRAGIPMQGNWMTLLEQAIKAGKIHPQN